MSWLARWLGRHPRLDAWIGEYLNRLGERALAE